MHTKENCFFLPHGVHTHAHRLQICVEPRTSALNVGKIEMFQERDKTLITRHLQNGVTSCVPTTRYCISVRALCIINKKLSYRLGTAQLTSCQLPRNSAETTFTTSPDHIDVIKLEV